MSLTVREHGNCIKTSDSSSCFLLLDNKSDFCKVSNEMSFVESGLHAVVVLSSIAAFVCAESMWHMRRNDTVLILEMAAKHRTRRTF